MNNYYNGDMYLKTSDLNSIENNIELITNEIQQNVFNNQQSPLRNLQVGDNLNGKILYLSFPKDLYQDLEIELDTINIITTDNRSFIRYITNDYSSYMKYKIYLSYLNTYKNERTNYEILYTHNDNALNPIKNNIRIKLPYDFGIVTQINTNNEIYQYIKIYDDENIIPNYVKHTWNDNELLTMKKIDNIENGIKNIGNYYYKPYGWVNDKEWLHTILITDTDNGFNKQNISYQDLNRWITNLSLINFDDLENICIWNSNISNIEWNTYNDTEWEEL